MIWIVVSAISGFLLGMAVMAYLILSQNPILSYFVFKTNSTDFIRELKNEEKK